MDEAVAATHGEVVKNTGDGVMAVFRDSAVSAVTCAATMHDKVEALDVDPPAFVRVGVSAGEVAPEHGDYFGTPVIEAARLCDAAKAGQTLVSDVVRVLVGSRGGHAFRSVGARHAQGPYRTARQRRARPHSCRRAETDARSAAAAAFARALRRGSRRRGRAGRGGCRDLRAARRSCEDAGLGARGRCRVHAARRACALRSTISSRVPHRCVRRAGSARGSCEPAWPMDPGRVPALPGNVRGHLGQDGCRCRRSIDSLSHRYGERGSRRVRERPGDDGARRRRPRRDRVTGPVPFDAVARVSGISTSSVPTLCRTRQDDPAVVARWPAPALCVRDARLKRSGIDPADYRLDDQAGDVVDLVHALGLHSVDLAGGYDGALIVFRVANMAPDAIRSVALVNPAAPLASFRADATASLASSFDSYVSLCQADARCRRAYPDLARAYQARVPRVRRAPAARAVLGRAYSSRNSARGPGVPRRRGVLRKRWPRSSKATQRGSRCSRRASSTRMTT